MGDLSWWHWLIVVLVFVLLFGSKRLPDAARSLGKSMRILKTEVKGLHDDDVPESPAQSAALPPAPPASPAPLGPPSSSTPASPPADPAASTATTTSGDSSDLH